MSNYRRPQLSGACYFFTVCLHDRHASLLTSRVRLLGCAFRTVRAARPFAVEALVVLPDHLHCIWRLPAGDADFATRWRHLKTCFVKGLPRNERRDRSRCSRGERGVWQRRFWEHLIRDEDDYAKHVSYIHYNPVKHGYVLFPSAWPHSSIHRHIRAGTIAPEWAHAGTASGPD